jgi:probable addiction module antidote protein
MGTRSVRKTHNEHLRDSEIAAAYLNEAIEANDSAVLIMAIRNLAEAQKDGITGLADRTKLGRESLYKTLGPKGNPKLKTFSALIQGFGLKLHIEPSVTKKRASG